MKDTRVFDRTQFEVGDIVIAKNKDSSTKPETIVKSEMVKNLDGFEYNVIYFKSNPKDFHVGFQYEPYNKEERKKYYEIWSDYPYIKSKTKSKKNTSKGKGKSKVIKLNLKK